MIVILDIHTMGMKIATFDLSLVGMAIGIGLLAMIPFLGIAYRPF
jgi:hypothetical protein